MLMVTPKGNLDYVRRRLSELKPGDVYEYVDIGPPKQMCVVEGKWFAIESEPRQDEMAKGEIGQAGFVVYWPRMVREERHGRGQLRYQLRPMFPQIMFVKCEPVPDHWGFIKSRRGVRRLLGCGAPLAVADGAIEVVKLKEAEAAARERERVHRDEVAKIARDKGQSGLIWDFKPDEVVRIKHGPFAGFYAQLTEAVDGRDRIKALVSLFGRSSVTELSAFDIERLGGGEI